MPTEQPGPIMLCQAVLLDLDGVLVDSSAAVEQAWRTWATQRGLDPAAVLRDMHGRPSAATIAHVAPHLDVAEEVRAHLAIELALIDECRPYPGAGDLLAALGGQPHAIVTSGVKELATARLRQGGLPVPSVFVTADQLSAGKPDPEGYLLAAQRLDVAPAQCAVIEDSVAGLEAATRAGMRTVGVATTHAAASLALADVVIDSLRQLTVTPHDSALALHITTGA